MNLTYQKACQRIHEAFGSGEGLRKIPRTVLARASFAADDAGFLSNVGVPREEILGLTFNLMDRVPRLWELASERGASVPDELRELRCIDSQNGITIGIDVKGGGRVLCVDLGGEIPAQFINSRLVFLVSFLAECVLELTPHAGQISRRDSLRRVRSWMQEMDPSAVSEGTWWGLVLEQVQLGVL